MRKILLLLLCFGFCSGLWAQADDCSTLGVGDVLVADGDMISDDLSTYADEGNYVSANPGLPAGGIVTGFSSIEWDEATGYYSINAVSGSSTLWSVSLAADCTGFATPANEIFSGTIDGTGLDMSCFYMENGGTYILAYATATGAGTSIDFTFSSTDNTPANNVCANAEALNSGDPIFPNCVAVLDMGSFADACPTNTTDVDDDASIITSCAGLSFANEETVWYRFTVEYDCSVEIGYTNAGGNLPHLGLFSGSCGGLTPVICDTDGSENGLSLTAGTDYFIAISAQPGVALADPALSFSIEGSLTVPNETCSAATATTLADGGAAIDGTTACASDSDIAFCNVAAVGSPAVYYQYEVIGTEAVNLEVTINTNTNTTGVSATDLGIEILSSCGTPAGLSIESGDACDPSSGAVTYNCLLPGTYFIAVGSSNSTTAGDFDIAVASNTTGIANHNNCTDAFDMGTLAEGCMNNMHSESHLGACPSPEVPAGCGTINSNPTVWATFTTDVNTDEIQIDYTVAGQAAAEFTLLTGDCAGGFTVVGACQSDGTEVFTVMPSTTYFVAMAPENTMSGDAFDLEILALPSNDDCVDAEALTSGTATAGTTLCASATEMAYCGQAPMDMGHVVYYSYTLTNTDPNQTVNLVFDVSFNNGVSGTDATAIEVGLFGSCGGMELPYGTTGDNCTDAGSSTFTYNCVPGGATVLIAVGSPDGSAGDFEITVTEEDDATSADVPDNDDCANAEDVTTLACENVNVSGDNTNACPENLTGLSCDYLTDPVVWYSVILPADAIGLEFTNLTGDGVHVTLFNESTCPPSTFTIGNECFSDDQNITGLTGGATYLMGVGTDAGSETAFDFDVLAVVPPANDMCAMAEAITGTGEDSPVTTTGTTACATPDANVCALDATTSHVVWYTYTLAATTNTDIEITINPGSSGATPIMTDVDVAFYTDCAYTALADAPDGCNYTIGDVLLLECINPAETPTITIAVGSADPNEGEFDIVIEEKNYAPVFDNCSNADMSQATLNPCEINSLSIDDTNSCPESITGLSCDLENEGTVWMTVDMPTGGIGFEFSNISAGGFIAVFENNCASPTLAGTLPGGGAADCFSADGSLVGLAGGTTYLLAVGQAGATEGVITFDVLPIVPPANDMCATAETISGTGENMAITTVGTTACATPDANVCALDANTSHVVWYTYTLAATSNTDIQITINAGSSGATPIMNDVEVAFYTDCAYTALAGAPDGCNYTIGDMMLLECVNPMETPTITIAVGSAEGNEGEFDIIVEEINYAPANDNCVDTATPVMLDVDCTSTTVSTTTENACPEASALGTSCNLNTDNVVWHLVTLPAGAVGIEISDLPATATASIFTGSCASLTLDGDCFLGQGAGITAGASAMTYTAGDMLWIAVSTTDADAAAFDFEVLAVTPPSNDACLTSAPIVDGDALTGTTACATEESVICGLDANTTDDHIVWYQYVNNTGLTQELEITVTGTDASFAGTVVETFVGGCTGLVTIDPYDPADNTMFIDECSVAAGTTLNFECILPTENVFIAVASPDGSEGEFTITLNEVNPAPSNDECANSLPLTVNTDCTAINVSGTTGFACAEPSDLGTTCAYGTDAVVWYSVTLPAGAVGLEMTNLTPNFYATYFTGACGSLVQDATDGCFTDAGNSATTYTGGNQILIGIGSTEPNEGAFTFDLLALIPPANDLCANAELIAGGGENTPVVTSGTTGCATEDFVLCGLEANTTDDHIVWYQYTNNQASTTQLQISLVGTDGIFNGSFQVFEGADCTALTATEPYDPAGVMSCTQSLATDMTYDCIAAGESIWIAVQSVDTEEGTFDLTITELNPAPSNDECTTALSINTEAGYDENITCAWQVVGTYTNQFACPDMGLDATCNFAANPTVWFEVTPPVNATSMSIEIEGAGGSPLADPTVGVYNGNACAGTYTETAAGTGCDQSNPATEVDIPVVSDASQSYYIVVGTQGTQGGEFEFRIKFDVLPPNDLCTDPNGIYMAEDISTTAAAGVNGTNSCATPHPTAFCGLSTMNSHTVYYSYTTQATTNTTVTIAIDGQGTAEDMTGGAIEVWEACDFATEFDEPDMGDPCDAFNEDLEYECVPPGTVLIIAVASADGEEGNFTITITEDNADVPMNDVCTEALPIDFTDPDDACEWIDIITANSVNACPEGFDFANNCGFDDYPMVWYSFTALTGATSVEFDMQSASTGAPVYALFDIGIDCNNLTAVSDCQTGTGMTGPFTIVAGQQYLVGIGVNDADGGTVDFSIKQNVAPPNDMPCDAEVVVPNTNTPGTTLCATTDFSDPDCTADQAENSVWYTYTLQPGETGIEITIPVIGTDVGPINVMAVDACTGTPTIIDEDGTTCDAATLTDPLVLSCLDPEQQVWIMVSTSDDTAGDFEILIEPIVPEPECVDNDLCDDAVDQGELVTDEECTPITGECNQNACADQIGDCGEVNNVVWYTVQNDGMGEFINVTIENAEFETPIVAVFTGSCAALAQLGNCETGAGNTANTGPIEINPGGTPVAGEQYWIAVGSDEAVGGNFDICIEITAGCPNDDPCNGVALDANVVVDNPASTINCSEDTPNPNCSFAEPSTVWYTFEVPVGFGAFEVIITNINVPGDFGVQAGPYSDATCNNLPAAEVSECGPDVLAKPVLVPCTPEGATYYIQVMTDGDTEEGDFTIEINPLEPQESNPPAPQNDICSNAEEFVITEDSYCSYITLQGTTVEACVELFDVSGGCTFSQTPTVWYTFTVPNDPRLVDVDILLENVAGLTNPMAALLQVDCADVLSGTAVSPCITGGDMVEENNIPITPGETYHLVVASQAGDEGLFEISIKLDAPPINDSPCPTADTPPVDLSGGGSHGGTTCCANGFNDDPALDYPNQECSGVTDDDAVWYFYDPSDGIDGFTVSISSSGGSTGIQGNTAVEIYSTNDPNAGCTGALTIEESSCGQLESPTEIIMSLCDPTLVYYIKIASSEDNCGSFNLSIDEETSDCTADECPDAEVLMPVTPVDCEAGEQFFSVDGCVSYACPEMGAPSADCNNGDSPTVWFQIDIDAGDPTQLVTQVDASGFTPVWNIYQGTDCSNLEHVAEQLVTDSGQVTNDCSNSDDDPTNNFIVPIADNPDTGEPYTYWIAISAVGDVENPDFTLNYATSLGCLACTGETALDCGNGEFTATVDGEEWDPDGDGVSGPFCPGQEVEICWEFNYDTTGSGNDWLHGMIPSFGSGWDLESIDFASESIGGSWTWYDENDACYPRLQGYNLPNICTYEEDGILKLCNKACDPSCPCDDQPLEDGSPLPSGWFWNSAACGAGDCPHEEYGIPNGVNVNVDVCVTLSVKTFDSDEDCELNRDLKVVIQTTSDAVTGCWTDSSPCIVDPSLSSPDWEIDCDIPARVTGDEQTICSGDMLDIDLEIEDGDIVEVVVEPIDNPSVDGETMNTFPAGDNPVINDVLINNSEVLQEVLYEVYTVDPTKPCPGVKDTIFAYVEPQIEIEFPVQEVCAGFETTLDVLETGVTTGGTGNYVDFVWSPGLETTPSITVMPPVTTQYCVTVTDDFDCTGSTCVEVFVGSLIEFELVPSLEIACQDGVEDFNLVIDAVISSGTAPFNFDWNIPSGLDYTIENGDYPDSRIVFNEETSDIGTFFIDLTLYDAQNCEGEGEVEIAIGAQPEIFLTPGDIPCAGSGDDHTVNIVSYSPDASINMDMVEFYDCSDPAFEVLIFSNNFDSQYDFTYDPEDYPCVRIVLTDENGCTNEVVYEVDLSEGTAPIIAVGSHCIGDSSQVSVTNASDFSSFLWSTGETTSSIMADDSMNTQYQVTVTDANGCTGATNGEVVVNTTPTVSIAGSTSYCGTSGTTLTADGGDTYQWTDASNTTVSNTAVANINAPGMYTVVVTSTDGCTKDTTVTVAQADNLEITVNEVILCDGGMGTMSAGDNPNYSYSWEQSSNPGVEIGTTFSIDVTSGEYCVTVTDNTEGCTGSTCETVVINTTPVVEVTDVVTVCNENIGLGETTVDFDAQVITSSGGTWVNVNTQAFDLNVNPVDFAGLPLGDYIFEYRSNTAEDPCEDVVDSMVVTVIECACPSVDLLEPETVCNDGTIFDLDDLKNNGNAGTWTPSSGNPLTVTGTSVDFTGVAAGEYFFTWTLDNPVGGNCPESNQSSVIVVAQPVGATVLQSVCNAAIGGETTDIDLNTTLTPETTMGGVWTDTDGTPLASTIVDLASTEFNFDTTFLYTVMGDEPCGPLTLTATVRVVNCACPQFLLSNPDILCNSGDVIDLNDYNVTMESGTWDYVSGGTGPVPLTSGSILDVTGLSSGLYQFSWTMDNPVAGCPDGGTVDVIVSNQPMVETISTAELCNNNIGLAPTTVDLFDLISGSNIGVWYDEDGTELTSAELDFEGTPGGATYNYTFITNTALIPPCSNDTTVVTVNVSTCECPNVDINPPGDLCNDGTLDLNSLKTPFTAPGTWNMNGPSIVNLVDDMVDLTTLVAGEYTIRYTLDPVPNGDCQLDSVLTFNLSVLNTAVVTNTASVCVMESQFGPTVVDFTSLITDGFTEGEWQNTDNAPVDVSDWANVSFDGAPANTSYVFTYVIDNDEPCEDQFYPVTVMTDPCDCPLITPLSPGVHCNNEGSLDLTQYNDPAYPNGSWSSTDVTVNANSVDLSSLTAGDYTLVFTADGIPVECDADREVTLSIEEFKSAVLDLDHIVCVSTETGSTILDFNSFILSGNADGTWEDTDNSGVDLTDLSNVNFEGLTADISYTFTYTIDNTDPCEDEVYMVEVMTNPCDCDIIMPLDPGVHCNAEGTLDLTQYDDAALPGSWSSTVVPVTANVADISGLAAGSYELIYTIDNPADDCPDNATVTLVIINEAVATVQETASVCTVMDQEPNALDFNSFVLSGDTSGTWEDTDGSGVSLADLSNVSFLGLTGVNPGDVFTFTYRIDNDDPCADPDYTIEVTILDCDCPVLQPANPGTHCSDEGTLDLTQYDDEDDAGTWSSDELTVTDNSVDLTGLVAGTYTLIYTLDVPDPNPDCPTSTSVQLIVVTPLSAGNAGASLEFCMTSDSEVVNLYDMLDDEDLGGTWTETSVTSPDFGFNAASGTFDIANNQPGTYAFTYSHDNADPCSDDEATVNIVINPNPTADAGDPMTIDCDVTSVTIGGNSTGDNLVFLWSEDSGAAIDNPTTGTIEVEQAGNYTLLVTDSETSCFDSDQVVVEVSAEVPNAELVATNVSCNGAGDGTISIVNATGGNGDYSYSLNGGPFGTQTEFTNLSPGTYEFVIQDSSGSGCTYTFSTTITQPDLMTLDIGPIQQVTVGDSVSFSIADQIAGFDVDNIVWTVNGQEVCTGVECESIEIEALDNLNVNVVVTYSENCVADAFTQVQVTRVVDVVFPNVISPNNDGNNDVFYVNSDDVESVLSMLVYDRWGELVFVSSNHPPSDPDYGWDGTFRGKPVNPAVFVYVVEIQFKGGRTETFSGDVTVIR